jgi:hypothetical protein
MKTNTIKAWCVGLALLLSVLIFAAGCSTVMDYRSVSLEYYNLSEKVIKVVDVSGMPAVAASGILMPYPGQEENPMMKAEQSLQAPLLIPAKIKILWLEGGTSAGSGSPHQAEIRRDEFGVPESLSNKAIRFIYLGNNQWRLKLAKRGATT